MRIDCVGRIYPQGHKSPVERNPTIEVIEPQ